MQKKNFSDFTNDDIYSDRFSPEFIEHRRKELERFLRRSANHPTLQHSEHLKAFLELSDEVIII